MKTILDINTDFKGFADCNMGRLELLFIEASKAGHNDIAALFLGLSKAIIAEMPKAWLIAKFNQIMVIYNKRLALFEKIDDVLTDHDCSKYNDVREWIESGFKFIKASVYKDASKILLRADAIFYQIYQGLVKPPKKFLARAKRALAHASKKHGPKNQKKHEDGPAFISDSDAEHLAYIERQKENEGLDQRIDDLIKRKEKEIAEKYGFFADEKTKKPQKQPENARLQNALMILNKGMGKNAPKIEKQAHEMTRAEYMDAFFELGRKDADFDTLIHHALDNEKISQLEADKVLIRDRLGNKFIWAQTIAEINQRKKAAVKNLKQQRAEQNKRPLYTTNWQNKSNHLKNTRGIEQEARYFESLLKVHPERIIEALNEGKPVPADVLSDYPDLLAAAA
jgi:hypothetical protein